MMDKLIGDKDDPFRPGDLVLEWLVFLNGMGLLLVTVLDLHGTIDISNTEWNFMTGMILAVVLVIMSGIMSRVRKDE